MLTPEEKQIDALTAERDTLREALEKIAEQHDAGRHDGKTELCPAHDDYAMWLIARAALRLSREMVMVDAQIIPHEKIIIEINGETIVDEELALAALLHAEVLMCNNGKFEHDTTVCLFVLCNDVFAWGCGDAEPVTCTEIQDLYEHWRKDKTWGTDVWCIKRRGEMPQKPVEDDIRRKGIWDLDSMGLKANVTDAAVAQHARAISAQIPTAIAKGEGEHG